MSSWIITKGIPRKKATVITNYHDTSSSADIPSIYMEYLAAYIYSQKMGEPCSIWDPTGILNTSFNNNPQVKLLKEKPTIPPLNISAYKGILKIMKLKDIQKYTSLLDYTSVFNRTLSQALEKASIRQDFDIGIHVIPNSDGTNLAAYVDILKAYQMKTKKTSLSVYIMSDSYATVQAIQRQCNPTWKIVSLSRTAPKDAYEGFIQMMAEAQLLSGLPAAVLDFTHMIDRYIYLIQRNRGFEFFKEVNDQPWVLL